MSVPAVVSKKLKFKGDKTKKKRKVHKEEEEGDEGDFAAMAAADPKGESCSLFAFGRPLARGAPCTAFVLRHSVSSA